MFQATNEQEGDWRERVLCATGNFRTLKLFVGMYDHATPTNTHVWTLEEVTTHIYFQETGPRPIIIQNSFLAITTTFTPLQILLPRPIPAHQPSLFSHQLTRMVQNSMRILLTYRTTRRTLVFYSSHHAFFAEVMITRRHYRILEWSTA